MGPRTGFWIAAISLAFCATTATGGTFSRVTMARLAALPSGHSLVIAGFPAGPSHSAAIRFERAEIYAPGAHLYVIGPAGRQEVPRSNLVFLRGYSDDGSVRVALALASDGSFDSGSGSGPEGSFILSDNVDPAGTHKFSAQLEEATLPKGFSLDFHCGNDKENLHVTSAGDLANQLKIVSGSPLAPAAASHALRFATVAVDTDSAFMQNLFGNNTTNANIWIAKMINSMNLTYERDLLVRLYLGTTILRTVPATDPYAAGGSNPITYPADGTDLDNFGNYWAANEGSVSRAFAVLLSGLGPCSSGCSASGIAWINSYCQKPSSGGSYAVVEVFSQLSVDPNGVLAAGLYDHELGHNFGADHTHCTDITTGQWAVATNTIDTCYNGEAGSGCYSGATTSCPVGGAGTIMSYCHIKGCGSNLTAFHTTQINAPTWGLLARINAAPAACLNTTDDIFWDSFEKPGG